MTPMAQSRLPSLTLPEIASGAGVSLRSGRGPLVLLTVHARECAGCLRLVEAIASVADQVRKWGGRTLVVMPGERDQEEAEELRHATGGSIQVLADPAGKVAGPAARVVIADEWGEVYFEAESGSDHALPSPAEVFEWVRFIGIQCPECEGPEGEWRRVGQNRP